MIHIYCGNGKGKSTCAFGLALRAAGRGRRVTIAQFLKGSDSGERIALSTLPGVTLLDVPERVRFTFRMSEEERAEAAERSRALLTRVAALTAAGECDMVVLDECCGALNAGLLPLEEVTAFLDTCPPGVEVVLTGRNPPEELVDRADYVTRMEKVKHPFDRGIKARKGVEW